MINERLYQNPALDRKELAKALQINERTLANALREENDQTVLEYITMYRLENARHLLSLKNPVTLKEIAEQCGFGTLRTFQRSFRDRYGMPPSQYRVAILFLPRTLRPNTFVPKTNYSVYEKNKLAVLSLLPMWLIIARLPRR